MNFKERVTVCDVLDAEACLDEVLVVVARHGIEGQTSDLMRALAANQREWIEKAANANGSGSRDGYGSGYGSGSGSGDGSGYGYG